MKGCWPISHQTSGESQEPPPLEVVARAAVWPVSSAMPMTFRDELRAMVRLALPIVAVQVGQMLMGVVDTIMVGHVSPDAIAAVALGNLYFFGAAIFGMGALMALDPVVAQAVVAGDTVGVARGVQRGLILALGLSVVATALLLPARPVLSLRPREIGRAHV